MSPLRCSDCGDVVETVILDDETIYLSCRGCNRLIDDDGKIFTSASSSPVLQQNRANQSPLPTSSTNPSSRRSPVSPQLRQTSASKETPLPSRQPIISSVESTSSQYSLLEEDSATELNSFEHRTNRLCAYCDAPLVNSDLHSNSCSNLPDTDVICKSCREFAHEESKELSDIVDDWENYLSDSSGNSEELTTSDFEGMSLSTLKSRHDGASNRSVLSFECSYSTLGDTTSSSSGRCLTSNPALETSSGYPMRSTPDKVSNNLRQDRSSTNPALNLAIAKEQGTVRYLANEDKRGMTRHLVNSIHEIDAGDHVSWRKFAGYWHHAIVLGVQPTNHQLTVIHYSGGIRKVDGHIASVRQEVIDASSLKIYKNVYDLQYPPSEVVWRARGRIGEHTYNLFSSNCEHFARWCKTGVGYCQQLNNFGKVAAGKVKGNN